MSCDEIVIMNIGNDLECGICLFQCTSNIQLYEIEGKR
jgi:Na+-translocating ferredoxin:NAD+ oxidoreductase RnfC subunit